MDIVYKNLYNANYVENKQKHEKHDCFILKEKNASRVPPQGMAWLANFHSPGAHVARAEFQEEQACTSR